ncbi:hypothetical protein SAMN04487982_10171 [Streptomyces sp. ok210]|jgi:hypothetical protein|nr:hypothetical protein SAMN04487982_10171 [Streptomyces sp. ok210]
MSDREVTTAHMRHLCSRVVPLASSPLAAFAVRATTLPSPALQVLPDPQWWGRNPQWWGGARAWPAAPGDAGGRLARPAGRISGLCIRGVGHDQ